MQDEIANDNNKTKKPTNFKEQLEILRNKNLIISNENQAMEILSRISYYRFSEYMFPFMTNDRFTDSCSFNDIHNLYEFCKKLRCMITNMFESIEIAFRTHIAYLIAHQYGAIGYCNQDNFKNVDHHSTMLLKFSQEIERNDENFAQYHMNVNNASLPIWVVIEVSSFGLLSKIFSNLKEKDQDQIAKNYYNTKGEYVKTWLYSISIFRNLCAHHGRIHNRKLRITPKLFKKDRKKGLRNDTVFSILFIAGRLHNDRNEWTQFVENLSRLIEHYHMTNLNLIGFPKNWKELLQNCSSEQ